MPRVCFLSLNICVVVLSVRVCTSYHYSATQSALEAEVGSLRAENAKLRGRLGETPEVGSDAAASVSADSERAV
jgi:hypothetical protein